MLLTIANIPNQNWISKVQNPCYFIGNFVRIAANDEFFKQRTLFFPQSAKKWHFLRCCVRKHTIFCKENRKFAEVLDFEPIF